MEHKQEEYMTHVSWIKSNFRKGKNQKFSPKTDYRSTVRSTDIPGQSTVRSTESGRELGFQVGRLSGRPIQAVTRPFQSGRLSGRPPTQLCTLCTFGRPPGRPNLWNMLLLFWKKTDFVVVDFDRLKIWFWWLKGTWFINTSIQGILRVLVSKYTHFERSIWTFTSSEEFEVDEKRRSDPRRSSGRSQSNEVVVAWDGDEDLGVVWELGFELEMEKDFVKVRILLKWRKEKGIVKERIYIGFDFCKGDVIM